LATDLKIYRRKIQDPEVADEIREELTEKDSDYENATVAELSTGEAYRDFASWQSDTASQIPNRLGGGLENPRPEYLNDACQGPNRLPPPSPNTTVTWTPPGKAEVSVQVRDDGAIVHRQCVNGEIREIEAAHEYMHGIFNRILYDARDLLENINLALEAYAACVSETNKAQAEADAYGQAVTAFENFQAELQPGGNSPYAGAFNFVAIDPVVTNEGFIVSCRVKLNWKNPYHSSSTFKVP